MSEAAFAAAEAEAHEEGAELDLDENEGQEQEADADGDEDGDKEEEKVSSRVAELERVAQDKAKLADKERNRRREAERRAREYEQRLERLESAQSGDREADLLKLIDEIPDDDDDPIGKIAAVTRALKAFRAQQGQELEQDAKVTAQQAAVRRVMSDMAEAENDFRTDHPDYDKAAAHYKQAVADELEEQGFSGDLLQRELASRLLGLAQRAIAGGRDPAEVVYGLAKKRGFAAEKDPAKEKLKTIADAAAAGRSAAGGGGKTTGRLTYEYVASLKGAARDSAFAKLREQERRAG